MHDVGLVINVRPLQHAATTLSEITHVDFSYSDHTDINHSSSSNFFASLPVPYVSGELPTCILYIWIEFLQCFCLCEQRL